MTKTELEKFTVDGIAENNRRALDPAQWRLRWIYQRAVPTGTFFQTVFAIPASAALYRLEYLFVLWPHGTELPSSSFRPLYLQLEDDKNQKFFFIDQQGPNTSRGADIRLFTTPNVDPDPNFLAGDQAQQLGAMPLNLDFNGRDQITVTLRGATNVPNPAYVDFLFVGHQKNQVQR